MIKYIFASLLAVASMAAHAQVFDVRITPSDGSEVFTKTNAILIGIYPGNASPINVFSGGSDSQGTSLTVSHTVRYDFALTPATTINSGQDGGLPEGTFDANAPMRRTVEAPTFTEPELTGPALVLMREEGDPIIYYAKDGPIILKCNPDGEYIVGATKVQGTVTAVFYKDAHTPVTDAAVAATCTATGKTEGSHCSVCNTVLVAQQEVAAKGHNYVNGICERDNVYKPLDEPVNDYYKIENAGQLLSFAQRVNAGENSINGELTADIDMKNVSYIQIGSSDTNPYKGTLNGNQKMVKNLSINASANNAASFIGYTQGAHIENLTVQGTFSTTGKFAAGFIGTNKGSTAYVTNCISAVDIVSSTSGDGTHGGFVGVANANVCLKNCAFVGSMKRKNSNTTQCAGFIGWDATKNSTAEHCYVIAEFTSGICQAMFMRNHTGSFGNCYYLNLCGTEQGINVSAEQVSDGSLCYMLNGSTSTGNLNWYQKLGADGDPYPVLKNTGDNTVYFGYENCDEKGIFSNTTSNLLLEKPEHTITYQNGFGLCSVCGYEKYQPLDEPVNDYYEIKNAGQLYSFAALVNGGSNDVNGKLVKDIVVNDGTFDKNGNFTAKNVTETSTPRGWTPIGNNNTYYCGTFEGNNHSVSGLYCVRDYNCLGFIGCSDDGTIENLNVINCYISGSHNIGSVCGYIYQCSIINCSATGIVIGGYSSGGICGFASQSSISHCSSSCNVTGKNICDTQTGGIVGSIDNTEISDCYFTGKITGSQYIGGICGCDYNESMISNCYSVATIDGYNCVGSICGSISGSINNCYTDGETLVGKNYGKIKNCRANVSSACFASGEIAMKLNANAEDPIWFQNLGEDNYPVLKGDEYSIVYSEDNGQAFYNLGSAIEAFAITDGIAYASKKQRPVGTLTYTRTIKESQAGKWQALYVPFSASYEDWTSAGLEVAAINNFHEYYDANGNITSRDLEVRKVTNGATKANYPYLVRAVVAGDKSITIENTTLYSASAKSIACASTDTRYTFTGTYQPIARIDTDSLGYVFMGGGQLSQTSNHNAVLGAQRWYLQVEEYDSMTDAFKPVMESGSMRVVLLDEVETGINEIENGELKMENSIYNLQGQRLNEVKKGLNIVRGRNGENKKLIVK